MNLEYLTKMRHALLQSRYSPSHWLGSHACAVAHCSPDFMVLQLSSTAGSGTGLRRNAQQLILRSAGTNNKISLFTKSNTKYSPTPNKRPSLPTTPRPSPLDCGVCVWQILVGMRASCGHDHPRRQGHRSSHRRIPGNTGNFLGPRAAVCVTV